LCETKSGFDKQIAELVYQDDAYESGIKEVRQQLQQLHLQVSALEAYRGRAQELTGTCSELLRQSQQKLAEFRDLEPQLIDLGKAAAEVSLGLQQIQSQATAIHQSSCQDWGSLEERMRGFVQSLMEAEQSNPAKICQPLVECLEQLGGESQELLASKRRAGLNGTATAPLQSSREYHEAPDETMG
jgi:chromosome segregation ATPase